MDFINLCLYSGITKFDLHLERWCKYINQLFKIQRWRTPSAIRFFGGSETSSDSLEESPPEIQTHQPQFLAHDDTPRTEDPFPRRRLHQQTVAKDKENITPAPATQTTMSEERDRMRKKLREIKVRLSSSFIIYNPDNHPASIIKNNYNKWTEAIGAMFTDLSVVFAEVDHLLDNDEDKKKLDDEVMKPSTAGVNEFLRKMSSKMSSAESVPSSRASSAGSSAATSSSATSLKQAEVSAELDVEKIFEDIAVLSKDIKTVEDYGVADDHEIELGMAQTQEWKKRMRGIKNLLYNLRKTVKTHDLNEDGLQRSEAAVGVLEASLEAVIADLEYEDHYRCLFSLSKAKPGKVKFPSFGGSDEESFTKFKKNMIYAFKSNKTPRSEQVTKLRECLKGIPKTYISADLENIDEAWSIINFYGDPSRQMKAKKMKLQSMGQFPRIGPKSSSHLKSQVDYLMALEILMKDLFEVSKESQDMYCELFNPSMFRFMKNFFPITILDKFNSFEGCGNVESKMKNFLEFVIDLREKTQRHLQDVDTVDLVSNTPTKTEDRGYKDKRSPPKVNNNTMFSKVKLSRRNEECRVCRTLEAEGDNEDLYDDHYGTTVYGCPRFASMVTTERLRVGKKAQLCLDCFDADFVYRPRLRHPSCPVSERPRFYTCNHRGCYRHFFVCPDHVDENAEQLENSAKFWTSRGRCFSS